MKKDISKRKTPFFCILKGLSNKQKKFSCHMHFKERGYSVKYGKQTTKPKAKKSTKNY